MKFGLISHLLNHKICFTNTISCNETSSNVGVMSLENGMLGKTTMDKFIIIFYYYLWGGTRSTRYCGHFWPILQAPDDR
jgi:hypothetical protein